MRFTIQIPTQQWVIEELEAARRELGLKFTADLVRVALDVPSPKGHPASPEERDDFRRWILAKWRENNQTP